MADEIIMTVNCEGIEAEGIDLLSSPVVTDPLLIGYFFEDADGTVVESVSKPYVGMEFDTIEASQTFWEIYARETGFADRIRCTNTRKSDGVVTSRKYVCSREGKKTDDPRRPINSKRRPETRCGCDCHMTVSLPKGKGKYRVVSFIEEHNHELESKEKTRRNRPRQDVDGVVDDTVIDSVCKPFVGMEFNTVQASLTFWENYARDAGFYGRIRSTERNRDGVVRTRKYVCSREGRKVDEPGQDPRFRHRVDRRCGCSVRMNVVLVMEKGAYRVTTFIEEHNHGLDGIRGNSHLTVDQIVDEGQAFTVSVPECASPPTVVEDPLHKLTDAQKTGYLSSEFMQLAYRAVGNNELFDGVRRLISEGHSLVDKYEMLKGKEQGC